uniref:RNA-dependent DNA polymerase n=1 Tax=Haematococcus lacustris TaxID=44745 RepID=A0A2K9YRZ9_HAELA|nr:RNA-dependent DNA polymerase [Haematococcus lacustris]AUW36525.1 RNA-dependent DNA polymerase [Haematococcus lacustris]
MMITKKNKTSAEKKAEAARKRSRKKQLELVFTEKILPTTRILQGISNRSNILQENIGNQGHKFDDLYPLLCRKEMFIQALGNLQKNKGSMTAGTNKETIDGISMQRIEELVSRIKKGTFRFSPFRRIFIPKPGKKKKRPLGIPNFTDRLVQEAIRMILDAIYEPIFQKLDVNYGFRKEKSAHHAMHRIKKLAPACVTAIEGDIVGAYDNVVHDKLMEILRRTISDEKFLSLLKSGLSSGLLLFGKYKDTIIGTPQGGIASPLLFNIYMHEFDKFVESSLKEYITKYNQKMGRKDKPLTMEYQRISRRLGYARKAFKELKVIPVEHRTEDQKKLIRFWKKRKIETNMRSRVPCLDVRKKNIRIIYTRYADDWIILTNGTIKFAAQLKKIITE